jgi:hypothetical protein
MSDNTFTVDLGKLKLSDTQRHNINAAIQRAVAGELAQFDLKEQIVLIPVTSKLNISRYPWTRGFIADILGEKLQTAFGA